MRVFDSPLNISSIQQSMKYKNHESPITKLINMPDMRGSCHQARIDNVLNDRSNEVFVPRNASKYIEEPFEKKVNRQKEIEQIRRKYYEQSEQRNNRSVSQRYDRYEVNREKELRTQKRDQVHKQIQQSSRREALFANRPAESFNRHLETTSHNKSYTIDKPSGGNNSSIQSSAYIPQTKHRQKHEQFHTKQNIKPLESSQQRNLHNNSHLDCISEASNSNYETITKTIDQFSPEKNRGKSSFAVDARSNNRNTPNTSAYYYVDSFRNKENYKSIIKETSSVYEQSLKNSAGNTKGSNDRKAYQQKDDDKSVKQSKINQIQSRVEPYNLKPFSIQEPTNFRDNHREHMMRPSSRESYNKQSVKSYPTIYDNFIPNAQTSTTQKSIQKQQQLMRPRTLTEQKKIPYDQIKQTNHHSKEQKDVIKKRVLNFGDDDRIKEIQKRLKDRQNLLRKKQQSSRNRCQTQYDKKSQITLNRKDTQLTTSTDGTSSHTPQNKNNFDKQIEKLSQKIKQFEDRKKQLNIQSRNIQSSTPNKYSERVPSKTTHKQQDKTRQPKEFQNARKALQQYRQSLKPKSTSQVYQAHQYNISSSVNNEESSCTIKNYEQEPQYKKQLGYMMKQKQSSKKCDFIENTKPMYSERTLPLPSSKRQDTSRFGFKLFKIQSEDSEQLSSCRSKITTISSNSMNANECRNQFDMYRRTDDGIEQRKKKLQQNKKSKNTNELKRLVSALSQQSIHDEEFRNCKIWFHNQRDQNKWKDLKRTLKQYPLHIQYTEAKDGTIMEFHICEDENNPFFSVNQESKFTYQALARAFVTCKKHWQQNIAQKYDRNALKSQGLSLQKFDLEKRGYINLEDFVRFLNFESGNFYRNRDLILIFKRFLNESSQRLDKSLTIEKIFNVLSC